MKKFIAVLLMCVTLGLSSPERTYAVPVASAQSVATWLTPAFYNQLVFVYFQAYSASGMPAAEASSLATWQAVEVILLWIEFLQIENGTGAAAGV